MKNSKTRTRTEAGKQQTIRETEPARSHTQEKFTPAQVIAALEAAAGIRFGAAQKLRCCPTTITNYIQRYPDVKAALDVILENRLDLAEGVIIKRIADDRNPAVQANCAQFYLRTMGATRGYGSAHRTLRLAVPNVESLADVAPAMAAVFDAVTASVITPEHGRQLTDLLEVRRRALAEVDVEERIAALERRNADNSARH